MYILTIYGKETDGAYSVVDAEGEEILYIFEDDDDAVRYAMMLEDEGSPEMHVIEMDQQRCKCRGTETFLMAMLMFWMNFEKNVLN